ncbi:MAG: class I adenylate-forming enzyme family protein [Pseudolabrys sp.]
MSGFAQLGLDTRAALQSLGSETAAPGARAVSAAAMIAAAETIAAALRAKGSAENEPVVVFIANEPPDLAGFLGIWLAGCVAAPIHVTTPAAAADALIARLGSRFAVRAGAVSAIGDTAPPRRKLLKDAALIVFTSGSTGQPKGVVVGHEALSWKLGVLSRLLGFTRDDIVAVPLQLTFIFGIWVSLLALQSGSRLLLTPKLAQNPEQLADATLLAAVPTLLRTLTAAPALAAPKLRAMLTGGEPFPPALAERIAARLPAARIVDLFGLTETGSCDFAADFGGGAPVAGTIGRPTEGVAFRIAAQDPPLPGGAGELQVRTPARMLGYLDDPALTQGAFAGDYFRTGDLACLRDDGLVELVGRSKDIISRGGNKIGPLEIENVFTRQAGVAAALAFGVPDERLGECLHLMIVRRDGALSEDALRDWASPQIERYKLPDAIHFVDTLPVGRTGKADRGAARLALHCK